MTGPIFDTKHAVFKGFFEYLTSLVPLMVKKFVKYSNKTDINDIQLSLY